jgi:alkyl hydroperoxide reductase subunit AhpC
MGLHIGSTAPDFEQDSTSGRIRFHEWAGDHWVVLFSHPADFTPVCTTELGAVAKLASDFAKRHAKILALSVDPLEAHQRWVKDIEETQGAAVDYPILADADRSVSQRYDLIHPELDPKITVRSVFVIDPSKKIRATITYPPSAGRSFSEVLRLLDSLQLTDRHQVATPADWQQGEDVVIVPSLTDPQVLAEKFPHGYRTLKPYLRLTAQPDR